MEIKNKRRSPITDLKLSPDGTKVAYVGQGLTLKTEATKIQSEGFTDEEFATAPSNWPRRDQTDWKRARSTE